MTKNQKSVAYRAAAAAMASLRAAADRGYDEMTGAEEFTVEVVTVSSRRSAGVARSWTDPATRQARITKHAVICDGVEYSSLEVAFKALGLPMSKFIGFRKDLKAAKEQVFGKHDFFLVEVAA